MVRRRAVLTLPMMVMERATPAKLDGGHWGRRAVRFPGKTRATSPRLLTYRMCIAGELRGKSFASIGEVQKAFKTAASKCKGEAAGKPTIKKPRGKTYI